MVINIEKKHTKEVKENKNRNYIWKKTWVAEKINTRCGTKEGTKM
jgi:hypothetical protein